MENVTIKGNKGSMSREEILVEIEKSRKEAERLKALINPAKSFAVVATEIKFLTNDDLLKVIKLVRERLPVGHMTNYVTKWLTEVQPIIKESFRSKNGLEEWTLRCAPKQARKTGVKAATKKEWADIEI